MGIENNIKTNSLHPTTFATGAKKPEDKKIEQEAIEKKIYEANYDIEINDKAFDIKNYTMNLSISQQSTQSSTETEDNISSDMSSDNGEDEK